MESFMRQIKSWLSLFLLVAFFPAVAPTFAQETVAIDGQAHASPFPHFWEGMFGSGHAILSLRQSYRDDLRAVKSVADFRYVRFHGIFDDEVGVYNIDRRGKTTYDFSYVDQIYDGLLANGVRPYVEISFMPRKLAGDPDALHSFWYKPNVSPPWSMDAWDDLIRQFAQHLIARYGIDEVSHWYFEVWNEPNIDFWYGAPRQSTYFDLYAHTARALKSVNARLRVGGPSTAQAAWVTDFLKYTSANHIPVDFVSTHAYADDTVENLLGTHENIPVDDRVCRAVAKVHDEIKASDSPGLPFFLSEWNVQGVMDARDTIFMGPAIANTVRECDGSVTTMSLWTFSDVFEEGGPIPKPFVDLYGLRAKGGIDKPSFYAFQLLHQLGDERLANASKDVIVTRTSQGSLVIAAWNLVDPGQHGPDQTIHLTFRDIPADARVTIERMDSDHGNVLKDYAAMGSPLDPTPAQVEQLNRESALPPPEQTHLTAGSLDLHLTPDALAIIKVER
jgi:xylan 1,4-beta-xylosidase